MNIVTNQIYRGVEDAGERERRGLRPRAERSFRVSLGEWRCGDRVTSGWTADATLNGDLLPSGLVCVPAWLTDFN